MTSSGLIFLTFKSYIKSHWPSCVKSVECSFKHIALAQGVLIVVRNLSCWYVVQSSFLCATLLLSVTCSIRDCNVKFSTLKLLIPALLCYFDILGFGLFVLWSVMEGWHQFGISMFSGVNPYILSQNIIGGLMSLTTSQYKVKPTGLDFKFKARSPGFRGNDTQDI